VLDSGLTLALERISCRLTTSTNCLPLHIVDTPGLGDKAMNFMLQRLPVVGLAISIALLGTLFIAYLLTGLRWNLSPSTLLRINSIASEYSWWITAAGMIVLGVAYILRERLHLRASSPPRWIPLLMSVSAVLLITFWLFSVFGHPEVQLRPGTQALVDGSWKQIERPELEQVVKKNLRRNLGLSVVGALICVGALSQILNLHKNTRRHPERWRELG